MCIKNDSSVEDHFGQAEDRSLLPEALISENAQFPFRVAGLTANLPRFTQP